MAGRCGYGVVVPSASFVERQIKAGAFREFDRSQIPNWSNLDLELMQRLAQHDPGNEYAVTYMWGTNGIGYDEAKLQVIMPDAPVDSWGLVFDPAIAARFKDCGISVLDAPTDMVSIVLAYLGKDPNSEFAEDLELAEKSLMAIRPYIQLIDAFRFVDALANGEICIAVGWNGSVMQARDRAAETGQAVEIRYSIPKEGTIIWFDTLVIPKDAPHPDNAHASTNFLQQPDIAAANSNFIHYANGNAASYALLDESVRSEPSIYPPPEVRATLFHAIGESAEYSRLLNRNWTRFVTGS